MIRVSGAQITPDTISEHLQRIKDAEEYIGKFGKRPGRVAYLNGLHEQSSELLALMQGELERHREVIRAYDETARAMKRSNR